MAKKKVYLDLTKVDLYGWEGMQSKPKIDAIIRGIKARDKFPPVKVYKINDNTYQLTKLFKDPKNVGKGREGGHSRAVGHYLEKKPLECVIEGTLEEVDLEWHMPINIRDIVLANDAYAHKRYNQIKKRDPNYR